ncbi:ribonuclease D [uncultured Gilvimarinus sp.]|uniref:ribonuclease D n=1 Tax=uncultured Gilvimarinus sp. TaxID=1689143 RepID=UPI0030EBE83B|tara:strand:+ start:452 stop:1597 length:1146 start_codon:yes stop_codon:yes gene_type:complete
MAIPTDPIWVDTLDQLTPLCQRWRTQAAIAVDTEFMRSDTFYPIAGLIQIGDGQGCYLIDPLAFDDLTPLTELMLDEQVTKVLHACSEDLEVFNTLLGAVPGPIFDTQIGAAFAGCGFSLGYAALARDLLGVEIPKGETRSDWLQRPLSVAQLKYAALDVAHLLIVYGKLLQRLKADDRLSWVKSDCADLVAAARQEADLDGYYTRVGLGWKLQPKGLAVLRALSYWREVEARQRNIPRNRLMKEQPMYELARQLPDQVNQLKRIEGMPRRTITEDGETLLDIIAQELAKPSESWPERLDPPLGREYGSWMKALKAYVLTQAESHELPPEVLIRKKEYEAIVRSAIVGAPQLPERLNGWRYDVIGAGLLQKVQQLRDGANT